VNPNDPSIDFEFKRWKFVNKVAISTTFDEQILHSKVIQASLLAKIKFSFHGKVQKHSMQIIFNQTLNNLKLPYWFSLPYSSPIGSIGSLMQSKDACCQILTSKVTKISLPLCLFYSWSSEVCDFLSKKFLEKISL
jgi:hypothetical protein